MARQKDDVFDDIQEGCFGCVMLIFKILGGISFSLASIFYLRKSFKAI